MRDYVYQRRDGSEIPVAKMTNEEIAEVLSWPPEKIDLLDGLRLNNLRERLHLELFIRRNALR